MKLTKVISGGQTGVDQTSLKEAKAIGLETGGTAAKFWRTDAGPAPWLADYGLVQSHSANYAVRTHQNVSDSDCTVWFGKVSPGYWCTRNGCTKHTKPFYDNPSGLQIEYLCNTYSVINFAGNRQRVNPVASDKARAAFVIIKALKDRG